MLLLLLREACQLISCGHRLCKLRKSLVNEIQDIVGPDVETHACTTIACNG